MKKLVSIIVYCLLTFSVNAQKAEMIKGKWKYSDIADQEKLDSTLLKQAKIAFARTQIEFTDDGKLLYNPLGDNPLSQFSGTWVLNKEQTKVTVEIVNPKDPEKKQTSVWDLKGLTEKELKLDMGSNTVVVFNRVRTEQEIRGEKIKEELKQKKLKFNEGLAAVGINDVYGFIDATGKEVIPFKYSYAENFNHGIAKVRIGDYPKYKYGYIDKTGKEVVPIIYDRIGDFVHGLTFVCNNDKYGYVDRNGKLFIPLIYGGTWDFKEGLGMVRNGPWGIGKCGFIDTTGKIVIQCKYDRGDMGFNEGLALVGLNGKYGFIDKAGNEVVPLKYDFAFSFKEGLAVVSMDKKFGVIDKTGKEVTQIKYENADDLGFHEGRLLVKLNGKWGYIDKTGKEIIPFVYDSAERFKNGKAKVKSNGREFYIDKAGKEVKK